VTFDFEREALIASGVTKEDAIRLYRSELDGLLSRFEQSLLPSRDSVLLARELFVWLWQKKPNRYRAGASFRLQEVIRAQMSETTEPVGNCLGLTLLYNSLLRRKKIDARATYLENAFGIGPHVLTCLATPERVIEVENILCHGFDYNGHLNDPTKRNLGDRELVAEIYHSAGNEYFGTTELDEAVKNYSLAVRMDPKHQRAALNLVIVGDKIALKKDPRSK